MATTGERIEQPAVLAAVAKRGLLRVQVGALARISGVSESTARNWLRSKHVGERAHEALCSALGLPAEAPP